MRITCFPLSQLTRDKLTPYVRLPFDIRSRIMKRKCSDRIPFTAKTVCYLPICKDKCRQISERHLAVSYRTLRCAYLSDHERTSASFSSCREASGYIQLYCFDPSANTSFSAFTSTSLTALAVYIASFSYATVPALRAAPVSETHLAKQWKHAFEIGKSSAPPFALISSSCFAFLAYNCEFPRATSQRRKGHPLKSCVTARHLRSTPPVSPFMLYSAAALLAPCIVPYTLTVMGPTIAALVAKADGGPDAPSDSETKALIERWRLQNYTRAVITGTAAVLGAVAVLA